MNGVVALQLIIVLANILIEQIAPRVFWTIVGRVKHCLPATQLTVLNCGGMGLVACVSYDRFRGIPALQVRSPDRLKQVP